MVAEMTDSVGVAYLLMSQARVSIYKAQRFDRDSDTRV